MKNLQNKTRTRDQQIIDAENFLFRLSQQQSFDEDINQLAHNKPIQKRSRLIQLTPSIDEDGIIRSNSRLANAPVSTATKKPIILDGRNRIIRLFLELQHNINGHVEVDQQTHIIQLNFWVLQCKTVMKISNRRYECRRQRQLNSQPQMSDLPSYRFSVKPVAFKETGVEFFGPFEIYSQINTAMKVYCCLFTCLTIRAVHIEVTRNLQKESCIMHSNDSSADEDYRKEFTVTMLYISPVQQRPSRKAASQLQRYRNMRNRKRLHGNLFHQELHILAEHGNASLG